MVRLPTYQTIFLLRTSLGIAVGLFVSARMSFVRVFVCKLRCFLRDIDAIQRVVDVIMKWYGSEGGNALMDLGWVRASSQLAVVSITREHPLFPAKSAAIVILHSIVSQCAVACGFVFQVPGITALVSAADGSLPLPILIVWSLLCCATLPTAASSLVRHRRVVVWVSVVC
jgi:hypothetical protein